MIDFGDGRGVEFGPVIGDLFEGALRVAQRRSLIAPHVMARRAAEPLADDLIATGVARAAARTLQPEGLPIPRAVLLRF